jgi:Xaa-Pro aminopeptidase
VPERHRRVFEAVKAGRDAAVELAQDRWRAKRGVQGWELDDATRTVIERAGYGKFIKHRTGHSLSAGPMVHGVGVNIDNLETHDTREILPGVGFTVEPGVYIPDGPEGPGFGVRLEINVFADPIKGPRVTSCVQNDVVIV